VVLYLVEIVLNIFSIKCLKLKAVSIMIHITTITGNPNYAFIISSAKYFPYMLSNSTIEKAL
jgi:hypothetical protein